MPLTPQDVADTLNKLGIDTPDKFAGMLSSAAASLEVATIDAQIAQARAEAAKVQDESNARIDELNRAKALAEAKRDGLG